LPAEAGWVGGAKFDNPIAVGVEVPVLEPALGARAPFLLPNWMR
jgi:hypothetical protein